MQQFQFGLLRGSASAVVVFLLTICILTANVWAQGGAGDVGSGGGSPQGESIGDEGAGERPVSEIESQLAELHNELFNPALTSARRAAIFELLSSQDWINRYLTDRMVRMHAVSDRLAALSEVAIAELAIPRGAFDALEDLHDPMSNVFATLLRVFYGSGELDVRIAALNVANIWVARGVTDSLLPLQINGPLGEAAVRADLATISLLSASTARSEAAMRLWHFHMSLTMPAYSADLRAAVLRRRLGQSGQAPFGGDFFETLRVNRANAEVATPMLRALSWMLHSELIEFDLFPGLELTTLWPTNGGVVVHTLAERKNFDLLMLLADPLVQGFSTSARVWALYCFALWERYQVDSPGGIYAYLDLLEDRGGRFVYGGQAYDELGGLMGKMATASTVQQLLTAGSGVDDTHFAEIGVYWLQVLLDLETAPVRGGGSLRRPGFVIGRQIGDAVLAEAIYPQVIRSFSVVGSAVPEAIVVHLWSNLGRAGDLGQSVQDQFDQVMNELNMMRSLTSRRLGLGGLQVLYGLATGSDEPVNLHDVGLDHLIDRGRAILFAGMDGVAGPYPLWVSVAAVSTDRQLAELALEVMAWVADVGMQEEWAEQGRLQLVLQVNGQLRILDRAGLLSPLIEAAAWESDIERTVMQVRDGVVGPPALPVSPDEGDLGEAVRRLQALGLSPVDLSRDTVMDAAAAEDFEHSVGLLVAYQRRYALQLAEGPATVLQLGLNALLGDLFETDAGRSLVVRWSDPTPNHAELVDMDGKIDSFGVVAASKLQAAANGRRALGGFAMHDVNVLIRGAGFAPEITGSEAVDLNSLEVAIRTASTHLVAPEMHRLPTLIEAVRALSAR